MGGKATEVMNIQRRYGVLGRSLAHSHSPALFADRFKAWGIEDASYSRFERPTIQGIGGWLNDEAKTEPALCGLNVTIPYKQSILPYLTGLTPAAEAIGAVNAIKPTEYGWIGHNTDVEGFMKSLRPFLKSSHERALILGNGGAAAAVRHGLLGIGVEPIHVTRTPIAWNAMRYETLSAAFVKHCKLVVHCTPVGTYPDLEGCLDFPFDGLTPEHLVVDLVYNPAETALLRNAKVHGAKTMNGKAMLIAQAEAAWQWWNAPESASLIV